MTTFTLYKHLDLLVIKKMLIGMILAVILYIVGYFFIGDSRSAVIKLDHVQVSSNGEQVLNNTLEPLSAYEAALNQSSLFGIPHKETDLPVLRSSIAELAKDLRLKGVVIMDEPEAILMNASTNQSSFVREGEKVGELTVKSISEGSLILDYYGEEKVLHVN